VGFNPIASCLHFTFQIERVLIEARDRLRGERQLEQGPSPGDQGPRGPLGGFWISTDLASSTTTPRRKKYPPMHQEYLKGAQRREGRARDFRNSQGASKPVLGALCTTRPRRKKHPQQRDCF
jgi:hypothetical protein